MAYEIIDENRIPVALGVSNADGETIIPIQANPVTCALKTDKSIGGSDLGQGNDKRDENRKVAFMAVSAVDGVTPVAIYADSVTGALLVTIV